MRRFVGSVLTLACCLLVMACRTPPSAWAAEIPRKVGPNEAARLVVKAYAGASEDSLEPQPRAFNVPFIVFQGLGPVSGSYGFFGVNPWTGAVWGLWECKRLETPALRMAQEAIRRRFNASEFKHYDRLDNIKPRCDFP
jgi:hypothetical protein